MRFKTEPYTKPHHIIINLTTRCNLSCTHCFGDYGKRIEELSIKQWKKIIDDLERNEVFYVNITGGEPTQYPYFNEFIDYLCKKEIFFMLTTNGIFSKKIMKTILKNSDYLINVKVSLDGYDSKTYGFIRKSKNENSEILFNKCLDTLKELSKNNIPLTISTVIHPMNINNLENFLEIFDEIKIKEWLLSPLTFIGRAEKNIKKLRYEQGIKNVIEKKLPTIIKKLNKKGINVDLADLFIQKSFKNFHFLCGAAISFCEIHSDGTVSPCALSRIVLNNKYLKFDNIIKKPLSKIWSGKAFNKFREWQNIGCEGCKNFNKCNRCVPQTFLYFNNVLSPPPFCVSIGEKLGLKNLEKLRNFRSYKEWETR